MVPETTIGSGPISAWPGRCTWFVATLGGDNLPLVPLVLSFGRQVRVGLEDYQYTRYGQPADSQNVVRAAAMIHAMGYEAAPLDRLESVWRSKVKRRGDSGR